MCASVLQNPRDLRIAARTSMLKRGDAVPIGECHIGPGRDQRLDDGGMVKAAVAEHHGRQQGGVADVVDVIEWRSRRDESAHDLDVAAMRGGDQRRLVVRADDCACIGSAGKRDLQHIKVVVHRRDGEDIVALGIARLCIRAEPQQGLCSGVAAQKRRDMQRGSAISVLNAGLFAFGDELLDLGGVAARGGVVQPGIDAQLPFTRRRLREARAAAELGSANHESKTKEASHDGPADGQPSSTSREYHSFASLTRQCCGERQFGMRRTGLIVAPSDESCAARLISANG